MYAVLLRPRWLALHVLALVLLAACVVLSVWQFGEARGGDGRSLGYALQWPGFGLFVLGVWVWLCRDAARVEDSPAPVTGGAPAARVTGGAPATSRLADDLVLPPVRERAPDPAADSDPELLAYNRMLAHLNESDR